MREGYPPLFFGNSLATQVLVEIASREPVRRKNLRALDTLTAPGAEGLLRKMAIAGLLERWTTAERRNVFDYRVRREGTAGPAIRRLLATVGAMNGLEIGRPSPIPPESKIVAPPTTPKLIPKRGVQGSRVTWLGSPLRTLAIIIVALLDEVDESTIARGCAVKTKKDMLALLRPIERDGIFTSKPMGKFRLCRIADAPWREPLKALCADIADFDGETSATVAAARYLRTSGTHHSRAFLARYLRDGKPSYKNPGKIPRKSGNDE